jgi:hypothetical protein
MLLIGLDTISIIFASIGTFLSFIFLYFLRVS